jgi:hypothetical protein
VCLQGWFDIALPYFAPAVAVVVISLIITGVSLIVVELRKKNIKKI